MAEMGSLLSKPVGRQTVHIGSRQEVAREVPARGSLVRFVAMTAAGLGAVIVSAVLVGVGELMVVGREELMRPGLGAASAMLVLCAGLLALVRYASSADHRNVDLGVLMLLIGAGWLLPLRLLGVDDLGWNGVFGSLALGTAFSILCLMLIMVVSVPITDGLSPVQLLGVAVVPLAVVVVYSLVTDFAVTNDLLRSVAIPLLAVSAVASIWTGLIRHRWLMAFVGLLLMGIQIAELLGIEGREGDPAFKISAGMVALAAGVIGLYGVVTDIREVASGQQTRLDETRKALQSTQHAMLEERQFNQDRMHSLRSGLLGVEALVSHLEGPDGSEDVVATEVRRLRELTAKAKLDMTHFDLVAELRNLIELHHRRGVAVNLDAPGMIGITAAAGPLLDAISLLIDNAVRHAPRSPVRVIVMHTAKPVVALEISVSDHGPGVPAKMQKKIFDRGVTTHTEGTGIGLTVARLTAEAHGGELVYSDRLGGGATFTMRLPVDMDL